jgi:hypothetical protein
MKIYVAASMTMQATAETYAHQLRDAGFEVTSLWHKPGFIDASRIASQKKGEDEHEFKKWMGWVDMQGVLSADVVLLSTEEPSSSGGYNVELGIALTAHKTVVVLGQRWQSNVFYHLDGVLPAENIKHALAILRSMNVKPFEDSVHAYVKAGQEVTMTLMPPETVALSKILVFAAPHQLDVSVLDVNVNRTSYIERLRMPGRRVNIRDLEIDQPWTGEILRLGEVKVVLRNEGVTDGYLDLVVSGSILPAVDRPRS